MDPCYLNNGLLGGWGKGRGRGGGVDGGGREIETEKLNSKILHSSVDFTASSDVTMCD